ncbi:MAG: hypothetical protein HC819_04120 [Cyclobacteriaceae bacterium]|nr:hypothetical protein [Cyclobacteriaceae bacterium]
MNERIPRNCESCTEYWPGKTITMRDYSSRLGNLISVSTYDGENNLISKQETNYLHDNIDNETYREKLAVKYGNQGFTSELFNEFRIVVKKDEEDNLKDYNMAVLAVKEVYPSVVSGTTTTNYKTGITTTTKNLAFDFYSGAVTRAVSSDSYGNRYLSESIPAYHKYPGMGLAMKGGKNMLVQIGANCTYKVSENYEDEPDNAANKLGLVGASVQTWSQVIDMAGITNPRLQFGRVIHAAQRIFAFNDLNNTLYVGAKFWFEYNDYLIKGEVISDEGKDNYFIRLNGAPVFTQGEIIKGTFRNTFSKKSIYTWKGDDQELNNGLYPIANFSEFNAWQNGETPDAQWQKNSEITLIDVYSHALEAEDING